MVGEILLTLIKSEDVPLDFEIENCKLKHLKEIWKEAQKELLHEIQSELNTNGLSGVIEYCENKFKTLE